MRWTTIRAVEQGDICNSAHVVSGAGGGRVCIYRHNNMLQQRGKLEDLEKALKEEQMRMALEKEQHRSSAAECCRLRDEKDW